VNLAIAAAVFPIIFVGELPDKTMFASLMLATRGRPLAVWIGAAGAFVVHVVIAVTIGVTIFHLLPHRAVSAVVAALFLAGAAYSLYESRRNRVDDEEQREQELVDKAKAGGRPAALTAFLVIFLAEWGDLTQILTANLAAHYHSPLSVAVGSVLALWTVAALAVVGGRGLLRYVPIPMIRKITAVVLVILAGLEAYSAFA